MRHAAMIFGVADQTQAVVESLYLDYLEALNTHFEQYPYILGWRPSIGDFGPIAPMYAHLGRSASGKAHAVAGGLGTSMGGANEPLRSDVPEFFNASMTFRR